MAFEAVGGQLHQLGCGREIPVGGLGVDVPEIGRQQREPRLGVVVVLVGVEQGAHREPMSNVMQPWPTDRRSWRETGTLHQRAERLVYVAIQQPVAGGGHEQGGSVPGRRPVRPAEVLLECGGGRGVQWQCAGFPELALANGDQALLGIEVAP